MFTWTNRLLVLNSFFMEVFRPQLSVFFGIGVNGAG